MRVKYLYQLFNLYYSWELHFVSIIRTTPIINKTHRGVVPNSLIFYFFSFLLFSILLALFIPLIMFLKFKPIMLYSWSLFNYCHVKHIDNFCFQIVVLSTLKWLLFIINFIIFFNQIILFIMLFSSIKSSYLWCDLHFLFT